MTAAQPVIFDGDFGSDDCLAMTALLGYPDRFRPLGVTTVFGNTTLDHATDNALRLLAWLRRSDIAVHTGAADPLHGPHMFGDNAFGPHGLGQATLPRTFAHAAHDAVPWMAGQLRAAKVPVTIFAAGPLTNIARLLRDHPDVTPKIGAIIAMGGGLRPGPDARPPGRKGNITEKAEFNFFQDPAAANIVLQSGAPVHLVTMDATHQLTLNPAHTDDLLRVTTRDTGPVLNAMMRGHVETLDNEKFGADGPILHDPSIVAYALRPDLFNAAALSLRCTDTPHDPDTHGELHITNDNRPVIAVTGMKDSARIFDIMLDGFAHSCAARHPVLAL